MNTLVLILIAVGVGYILLMILMKMTKWIFRIALFAVVALLVLAVYYNMDFFGDREISLDDLKDVSVPSLGILQNDSPSPSGEPVVSEGTIAVEKSAELTEAVPIPENETNISVTS